MTTSTSDATSWNSADDAQKLMNLAFTGVPEGFTVQARQVTAGATTLTVRGSVVQEISHPHAPYDILYAVTET